jgi:hypothetical protein
LISTTAALANKADLPSVDINSEQIIGQYGSVYDASDGTVCRMKPVGPIMRRNANPGGFFRVSVYWYSMDDLRIYHTRTNVKADVCVYSRSVQSTAFDNDSNMLLPDSLADAIVCGAVGELVRDDEFMQQAQSYRSYYNEVENGIRNGLHSVPSKAETGPLLQAPSY